MSIRLDPEGHEIAALFDLVNLGGKDVLEIGCGDGRLTWRYAERARHVVAIEPFAKAIDRARQRILEAVIDKVELRNVGFEDFASTSEPSTFDVAILSWSLC
jgi:cyclopropane fatty-acyl-phospholipid synthase-like methyltransferase